MNLVIIGPPGSGKGTQAKLLSEKLGFVHVSSGQMLREASETSEEIKEILGQGGLVDDEMIVQVLGKYLKEKNIKDKIILDGTPRTLNQYQLVKKLFSDHNISIDKVILVDISDDEAVRRLSARRMDKGTGEIYNLLFNPPGPEVKKENLVHRDDDKEDVIRQRLRVQKPPQEMLSQIQKDGLLVKINGEQPIEKVYSDIVDVLNLPSK